MYCVCRSFKPGWRVLSQRSTSFHSGPRRGLRVSILQYLLLIGLFLAELWTCFPHMYLGVSVKSMNVGHSCMHWNSSDLLWTSTCTFSALLPAPHNKRQSCTGSESSEGYCIPLPQAENHAAVSASKFHSCHSLPGGSVSDEPTCFGVS